MDKTTTWLVRGAALVVILGGAFTFLKSDELKGFINEIGVTKYESKRKDPVKELCLDLYERATPEGSPPASSAFISKCRPIVNKVWSSCDLEASRPITPLDSYFQRYNETFKSCALKRLKGILPEN